jgi:hypothetical protein
MSIPQPLPNVNGCHPLVAAQEPITDIDLGWPAPLAEAAYHGFAGDFLRAVEHHSEADPVALLVSLLVACGAALGRKPGAPHFKVGPDIHYLNEFALFVGETSYARKGTSWGPVKEVLMHADESFVKDRVMGGLSSGEGLIWAVRDPIMGWNAKEEESYTDDPGVEDKRLLALESEYASVLKRIAGQSGNTLSEIVRQAWESGNLRTLTKKSDVATGAHIAKIGHITTEELLHSLSATEQANGFANRYWYFCVRRSKLLPHGGSLDPATVVALGKRLQGLLAKGRRLGELRRDRDADALWEREYERLTTGRPGLASSLLARAAPHVMRFASIYAALDSSPLIRIEHLEAALALWDYCEQSVYYIFGDSLGDPIADKILQLLRRNGSNGTSRTEVNNYLQRHADANEIESALAVLIKAKAARHEVKKTSGRPAQYWYAL